MMTAWHSVMSVPLGLIRAIAEFFRQRADTMNKRASGTFQDSSDEHNRKQGQDLKIDLAATLLSKISDGLSGHSLELAMFAKALAPANGPSLTRGPRVKMQEANQSLEDLVERTVDRLKLACGSLLSAEQSHLEAYQKKTNAFDKKLDDVTSELVLTHVVAELLGMVRDLHDENELVRNQVQEAQKKLCQLATRATMAERDARMDALTQLLNRRAFDEVHAACHVAGQEHAYCMLLLDADHFKLVNDRYGHAAGDAVLSMIGRIIRENCKATDHFSRWGGEEFAVLLPGGDEDVALGVAERLRRKIESTVLHYGQHEIKVTVSCGIVRSRPDKTRSQILEEADIAMYAAKKQGRNRSLVYRDGLRLLAAEADALAL